MSKILTHFVQLCFRPNLHTYTLLSNHPIGAQVGHAVPVVNRIGLSFNMEKTRIDCDP